MFKRLANFLENFNVYHCIVQKIIYQQDDPRYMTVARQLECRL